MVGFPCAKYERGLSTNIRRCLDESQPGEYTSAVVGIWSFFLNVFGIYGHIRLLWNYYGKYFRRNIYVMGYYGKVFRSKILKRLGLTSPMILQPLGSSMSMTNLVSNLSND